MTKDRGNKMTTTYIYNPVEKGSDGLYHESDRFYQYSVKYDGGDTLEFSRDGLSKILKVKWDPDYVWKFQKTQVRSMEDARGLFERIRRAFEEDDPFTNTFRKAIDWILDR